MPGWSHVGCWNPFDHHTLTLYSISSPLNFPPMWYNPLKVGYSYCNAFSMAYTYTHLLFAGESVHEKVLQ